MRPEHSMLARIQWLSIVRPDGQVYNDPRPGRRASPNVILGEAVTPATSTQHTLDGFEQRSFTDVVGTQDDRPRSEIE
ncbi:MAG: hypothetical protein M1118_00895 [Chloroflexi bacterium]|nr:hypothetical protein [Chloroflexota bacterium]